MKLEKYLAAGYVCGLRNRLLAGFTFVILCTSVGLSFGSIANAAGTSGNFVATPMLFEPAPLCSTVVTTTVDNFFPGSLRSAINCANGSPGTDTITFAISGSSVQTITLSSSLPPINEAVIIDGYSQPGSSPNTLAAGDNAVILIELNGSSAGFATGISINPTGGGSTIKGLVINRFIAGGIQINRHQRQRLCSRRGEPLGFR